VRNKEPLVSSLIRLSSFRMRHLVALVRIHSAYICRFSRSPLYERGVDRARTSRRYSLGAAVAGTFC